MKKIYLDYAATTPVDSEVKKAMRPFFSKKFGNAGSLHSFGQETMAAVDAAREKIANSIGAQFREIVFTGSATEANNLALRGAVKSFMLHASGFSPRIIVSAIEHESVLETAKDLERDGVEVVYIPVNREGIVDLDKLKSALNERTILVSVMYVNNEIGTVQPISTIAEIIREFKANKNPKSYILNPISYPLFHTDAAQAFNYFDCDVNRLGVDLMTLSGHKIYGPKGIGALYVRDLRFKNKDLRNEEKSFISHKSYIINPIITGGGQEFGLRSGTENVPAIIGFGKAVELATSNKQQETRKISKLREYFWENLKKIAPKAEINGRQMSPHILNVYFPNIKSQDFLTRLDISEIAASSGAACSARSLEPSYVIRALGYPRDRAERSIRFSFGKFLTKNDLDYALKKIKNLIGG